MKKSPVSSPPEVTHLSYPTPSLSISSTRVLGPRTQTPQPIYSSPLSNLVWIDTFDSWNLVNKQKQLWFLYSQSSASAQGISNRENLDGITIDFSFEFMKLSLNEICSNMLQVTGCTCLLLEKAAALGKLYLFSWSVAGSFGVLDAVFLLGGEWSESATGSWWSPCCWPDPPLGAAPEHGQMRGRTCWFFLFFWLLKHLQ